MPHCAIRRAVVRCWCVRIVCVYVCVCVCVCLCLFFVCVWRGGCTLHTIILGCGNGSARAPHWAVFLVWGRGQVSCFATALNMLPPSASSPDRKTSRTAPLFLRSFLSTAFLASFLSSGSQRVSAGLCTCMCMCVCACLYVPACIQRHGAVRCACATTTSDPVALPFSALSGIVPIRGPWTGHLWLSLSHVPTLHPSPHTVISRHVSGRT